MRTLKTSLCASVLILVGLFGSTSATASDKQGMYYAHGSISCSEFLEEQKTKSWSHTSHIGIVVGFISGFNLASPNTYNILGASDTGGALLWIKNYCEKQPLENLQGALRSLVVELYPRRLQSAP